MIDLEKEREAFEDGYANHLVERDDSGFYINDGIQNSWEKHLLKAEIDSLKAQLAKVESGEFVVVPKECPDPEFSDSLFEMLKPVCFGDVGDDAFVAVSNIDEQKVWGLMVKLAQGEQS
ncbi:hypothetical protein [Acinetobacter soli]|uniref:hypothetical protein n=1 Tax=Acinetobacter soli TaxID=487316 RepID=UPI00124EF648|nr:hypothetical protein [Acinetobacter soli]